MSPINRFHNLSKNNKQVLMLFSSTIAGILLGIISSILNTKFLSPYEYGDVKYTQNIINLFSCVLLLGYFGSGSRLLALCKERKDSEGIKGAMVILLLKTILALMVFVFVCYLFHIFCLKRVNPTLFLASLIVCGQPLMLNYINTTAQGDNQVGKIALARLIPSLIYVIIGFIIYRLWGANSVLMILLQWGIACIVLGIIIYSTKPRFRNIPYYNLLLNKENKRYGLHLYLGSLAMVATQYIAGITLGIFNTDTSNVAYYTLALTISMPLTMLPSIVGTSYFKTFATQDRIEKKVFLSTLLITVSSLIAFISVISYLINFIYPKEYYSVGEYASFLAIGKCCHGFGDMINRFLGAHGLGKQIRNASFVCGSFLLTGSIVLVYFWNIRGAVLTSILSSVSYMLVLSYYYRQHIHKTIKQSSNE